MRLFLLGTIALIATASAAMAGDDVMTNTYGNTLVSVSSGGMESHTYYNADHTFSGKVPALGFEYKGTWTIDDKGQLCRTFDPPVPGRTNPDCGALESHAVGDKWTTSEGSTVSLTQGVN
jgi:hypothetical protein